MISQTGLISILNSEGGKIMAYRSVNSIIHSASCLAAATAAGLAQVPGSDAPVLAAIQADMIRDIAAYYNEEITTVRALSLVATFSATAVGRFVSQWLVGWIPGLGNAINASTAAAITEGIGWAADAYFS